MNEVEKKKSSKTLLYILGGCGLLLIIGIVIAVAAFFVLGKKIYNFASNPEEAIVKIITQNNPDIEIISIDKDNKKITIRNKKTGEEMTIDFSDAKKGFIQWKGKDKKGDFKIEYEEKEGKAKITTEEGSQTITYGKDINLPDWVPIPSGFNIINHVTSTSDEALVGTLEFETDMDFDEGKKSIEEALKGKGFKYTTSLYQENENGKQVMLQGDKKEENISIFVILIKEDKVKCTLNYNQKYK